MEVIDKSAVYLNYCWISLKNCFFCTFHGSTEYYGYFEKVYSAFHPSGVGKWVSVIAGKAKAGMAHSDCRWTSGCAGKTVKSLENTCHTWALLWWWFTTKRSYIKCMDLFSFTATVHMWDVHGYALLMSSYIYYCCSITFNAFTLLVVWREGRPAC